MHQNDNTYKVREVVVEEQFGDRVEIRSGLDPGDELVAANAILLKPALVQSFRKPS